MGEDLLKSGAKKEDFAPVEIEAKAPADRSHFSFAAAGSSFHSAPSKGSKEGIDAGSDPVSIGVTALTDTFGGRGFEKINNESNLTGEKLNLSTGDRVIGGFMDVLDGGMNFMGVHEFVKPPGVAEPPVPRRAPAESTVTDTTPPKPTETSRDLFAEAMKRLPDAEKLSAASKAQRGIPDYMLGMADPGGPSSFVQLGMIDLWLAEPTLEFAEARMLVRMLFEEHPVLNDLAATQTATAGPQLRAQLNGIMQDFALETGIPIEVVPDGAVQDVRGTGDFGSMRSRPGYYEIEQSVYNDDVRLRNELTHQIPAYLGSRISPLDWQVWESPVTGNRNAAEWLEYFVELGGPPPAAE